LTTEGAPLRHCRVASFPSAEVLTRVDVNVSLEYPISDSMRAFIQRPPCTHSDSVDLLFDLLALRAACLRLFELR